MTPTKQQASDEREITQLVHACLSEHTNLTEKQREQFQLDFHRTDIPLFRVVELQVPNDTPGDPRLFACQWTENKWHVVPMPTALANFPPEA
ncbi:hypothetical protein KSC_000380 [Ktedonobacter sp. SOSP1-52]|uniref:hypothetical protein n=1 Tax=Ktedonobacter sp. SOSP1-52 TaxID=2778366 RepID=UPI0019165A32|nr:hypothetical protein [Ktedonobacter sp. SOSP1-52]GHO61146.1 hypothetical protein KSC_000380 [Ktedonobacter sp. SOSP1-52]